MAKETGELSANSLYSPDIALHIVDIIGDCSQRLLDRRLFDHPYTTKVRHHPKYWVKPPTIALSEEEYQESLKESGFAEVVHFRYKNGLSLAYASGLLPYSSLRNADRWHVRFLFPRMSAEPREPRPVLDTWVTASNVPLEGKRVLESGIGIHIGATNYQHLVFGRDESINPDTQTYLEQVLALFKQGVES